MLRPLADIVPMKTSENWPTTSCDEAPRPDAFCPTGARWGPGGRWLEALERGAGVHVHDWPSLGDGELAMLFAAAGRLFGSRPLPPEAGDGAAGRPADEIARMALLVIQVERANGSGLALVDERYRCGDNRERGAVLRALPHLPEPARFLRVATHACRSNVTPVFEAIAADNTYPADHFPDPAFHQMVLKALFVGVPVARIAGLARRHSPELARMAAGYASERRAAGRVVPADVTVLTGDLDR